MTTTPAVPTRTDLSRRTFVRGGGLGLLGLLGLPALAACSQEGGGGGEGGASATFALGQSAPIEHLTPHSFQQSNMAWDRAIYDALVVMDPDPQPHLASGWTTSDDGLVWELTIRDGVTFHDGTELTAQIVVDNLTWATDLENTVTGGTFLADASIEADGSVVRIALRVPTPQLLPTLAIIPIMDLTADLATSPNGTGPFSLTRFVPNSILELARNETYWDESRQPGVDSYEVRVYADNASMISALSSGQIHAVAFPPFSQLSELESNGNRVIEQAAPGNFMLRANAADPILQDRRVRQAISAALDRVTFANLTQTEIIEPTRNIYPSSSIAYLADEDADLSPDLDRARDLLAEAGYEDGLSLEMLVQSQRQPEIAAYAPVFQESLREIGVELTLTETTATLASSRVADGDYQLTGDWYPWGSLDPALLFVTRTFTPEINNQNFLDAEYGERVEAAQIETDEARRTELYQDLNQYMMEESFVIPLGSRPYVYVIGSKVAEFSFDPFGMADPASTVMTD